MTVQTAIADLQSKWTSISGISAAPSAPTEGTNAFPFAITYEREGNMILQSAGFAFEHVTLHSELHLTRQNLPTAIATAMPFRDSFLSKIVNDPKLSNSVSEVKAVRWLFGAMDYGDVKTLGYRFEVDVKVSIT